MKKILILLLSVVALLAFTSSAFALHGVKEMLDYTPSVVKAKQAQVELSGHIRIRGSYMDNGDFTDAADDDAAGYDQRVRLGIKATVSPNTMAMFELENGTGSGDGHEWGTGGVDGSGGVYRSAGNVKHGSLDIRQAYVSHQGTDLGMLTGFKAGHMLIALGDGTFYNHTKSGDDAIILWAQPNDNTEIAFAIIKGEDNTGAGINDNDIDIYAITLETAINGISLSGDIGYLRDQSGVSLGPVDKGLSLINLGLRAGMDVGGAKVNVGCDIQSGEAETFKASGADMDLSGYQCQVKASTKVGDVDVHGGFAYGSGDDIDSSDDYEGFITTLSSGGNVGTFVYDNTVRTAAQNTFSTAAGTSSTYAGASSTNGLANTWYLNVGATAKVTPDVSVNGEIFYLQASEKVSNAAGLDDEDIGVEVDGKITYQVDTALAYYVEAGILFAGDFYKNVTGATVEPDDVWRVRHGIVLSF
jgi:hypothetical protein